MMTIGVQSALIGVFVTIAVATEALGPDLYARVVAGVTR